MDFFARQEAARRATRWLLVAFLICVLLVVTSIGGIVYYVAGATGESRDAALAPAMLAAIALLLVIAGASIFKSLQMRSGGGVVARSLGGTRVERGSRDLALQRLHNVVEEMAIASGVTMPEVYVLEGEDGINAFAAGNSPADAAVAVTRGAVTRLNREELQGVIAHEFSHVLNGDMRLNSKLLGWVFGLLVIAVMARFVMQSVGRGGRRNDKAGAILLVALAVMVIGYLGVFVGRVLQAAVSRHRERLADASAVQFTRNHTGLVGALLKIAGVSSGSRLASPDKEEVAHMLFAPGMRRLFATHPPIHERVRALDPAFRLENFQVSIAEAARAAEQQRLAPTFDDLGAGATVSSFSGPTESSAAPARIARLTGTFDEVQQRYARAARARIPPELHGYADAPDSSRVLLFALLRSAHDEVASRQDDILRRAYGDAMPIAIRAALPAAQGLAPALRLPAVQQLMPALRRMTEAERAELRTAVQQFALADARIDVFECCLTLLLETALRDGLEHHEEHGWRTLMQSADAIATLFAVLATQGTSDTDAARRAYDAGLKQVLPHHARPYAAIGDWPTALRGALRELAALRPFAKRELIEGLVRTVAHDRQLSVAEGELLRTVCATLHCPLPPILSGGQSAGAVPVSGS